MLALSDINTAWTKELGLDIDLSWFASGAGLGQRSTRYALIIDDLVIKYIGVSATGHLCNIITHNYIWQVEENPTKVTVSSVDAVLAAL